MIETINHELQDKKYEQSLFLLEKEDLISIYNILDTNLKLKRYINFENDNQMQLKIADSMEDLIGFFQLRKEVYSNAGILEFNSDKKFEFDKYDEYSACIITKREDIITGGVRLILDHNTKLPSEDKLNLEIRNPNRSLGEGSRLVVKEEYRRKGELENLQYGLYKTGKDLGLTHILTVINENHEKKHKNLEGLNKIAQRDNYGSIDEKISIMLWDLNYKNGKL